MMNISDQIERLDCKESMKEFFFQMPESIFNQLGHYAAYKNFSLPQAVETLLEQHLFRMLE